MTLAKPRPTPHVFSNIDAKTLTSKAVTARVHTLPNAPALTEKLGKTRAPLMIPRTYALDHPAAPLLASYATHGCPVDCGPDWTLDQIMEALKYGAHPSAKLEEPRACLIKETVDKEDKGFARRIKWRDIKNNLPPQLKLSPVAMIPHKSRAFRCILDLSFDLKQTSSPSVNDTTIKLAPPEAMDELGSALQRILCHLAACQTKNRPVLFAKLDIKDGFWRMVVSDEKAWNFCYIIPPLTPDVPIDETDIVVPNSLQMGWCESPPFFCAASETARDIISDLRGTDLPPHPFEERMLPTNFSTLPSSPIADSTTNIEVFVDDFIASTDDLSQPNLRNLSRAMLHGIHAIFPPPEVTGHNGGDPISEKKLDKLEGLFDPVKEILGWILDGTHYTIQLPPDKVQKIITTIKSLKNKHFIKAKEFQKLAGTLNHAATGIPGGRGLFTAIWTALKSEKNGFIKLTPELQNIFTDFKWLFAQIATSPINIAQIIPQLPMSHGYTDACKHAAGGVWLFHLHGSTHRILWSIPFPADIVAKMEATELSINDLEMAGVFLGWLVLEYWIPNMIHHQAGIQCDNSSAVAWSKKFTAKSKVAGHLLRALALRQQLRRAAPLLVIPIPGEENTMADVASRFSSDSSLSSASDSLLSYFNRHFKQEASWTLFHLPQKLVSRVMSSLRGQQLTLESWRRIPKAAKSTGPSGHAMQHQSMSTPSSKIPTPSSEIQSLQHSLLGSGQAASDAEIKSKFRPLLKLFRPSARRSKWLDSRAPSTGPTTSTPSPSNGALKECAVPTHPLFPS